MRVRILLNPYAGFPHQELFFLMQQLYWLCLHPSLLWAPQREKPIVFQDLKGHFCGAKGGREEGEVPNFQLKTSWNLSYAQQLLGEVNGLRVGCGPTVFVASKMLGEKTEDFTWSNQGHLPISVGFCFEVMCFYYLTGWYPMCQLNIHTFLGRGSNEAAYHAGNLG